MEKKRRSEQSFGQAFSKACGASSPKRRLWRIKQGDDGAAVKIARRSKPVSNFGNRKRKRAKPCHKKNNNKKPS
ncbi:MAG: hypothetical protein J6Q79_06215 [Clostridia bacterium]|nr:hypothetical protein [Clostridia bacterium]